MNKRVLILIVVIIAIGFFAYRKFHTPHDVEPAAGQQTQAGGAPGQPMPVSVETLQTQEVRNWHDFSGQLVAMERVNIRPRVGGAIEKIYFEAGAVVEKGQPLFLIDPRPYQAEVDRAAATLSTARAQANLARTESERAQRLIKDNAISQREFTARMNAIQVAEAGIQSAEAALKQAKLNLDYATIKAPITGKISRAEITVGNLVDPAAGQVLAEIVSIDPIYADFDVDEETYLNQVRQGAAEEGDSALPVELALKNDTVRYKGKIESFDNKLDTTSGTIRARAIFENTDHILVPGMYATLYLGSADVKEAILIPDRYVVTDQDRKVVYVVGSDNKVEYRPVVLGGTVDNKRIVEQGLQPGEKIIVEGMQRIRPGTAVQPKEKTDDQHSDDKISDGKMPDKNSTDVKAAKQ